MAIVSEEPAVEDIIAQAVGARIHLQDDIAPCAAIPSVRAAFGTKFTAVEVGAAIAAFAWWMIGLTGNFPQWTAVGFGYYAVFSWASALRARDPFQNVYSQIANDLVAARSKLAPADRREIRRVAELRFAQDLAPDAFAGYLRKDEQGITRLARLPADIVIEAIHRLDVPGADGERHLVVMRSVG